VIDQIQEYTFKTAKVAYTAR